MDTINYNGVDGVFIPLNEFEYLKNTIKTNRVLIEKLTEELLKKDNNSFDYLLNLK